MAYRGWLTWLWTLCLCLGLGAWGAAAAPAADTAATWPPPVAAEHVRVAVFNVWELSAAKLDTRTVDGHGDDPQLRAAAEVIQRVRPDVLLLNEIDFDDDGTNARRFVDQYLAVSQAGQPPIDFATIVFEPVNTGVPSGMDFNNDGDTDDPEDAWGFGRYPGQYGMALLSRFPVDEEAIRTFRRLRWTTMPGGLMPDGRSGKPDWYNVAEAAAFRLSSKSHWDVPVDLGGRVLHVLASHPTPPVFDGDEDRNGRRNFDEIRLWSDYLSGGSAATYLVDDLGVQGGLDPDASFVVMGDLNADPGAPAPYGSTAIAQLLEHPRILDPRPRAPEGTKKASKAEAEKTSSYGRLDYVLPSDDLEVVGSGVFRPATGSPLHHLVVGDARASDHWLVWVDIEIPASP